MVRALPSALIALLVGEGALFLFSEMEMEMEMEILLVTSQKTTMPLPATREFLSWL